MKTRGQGRQPNPGQRGWGGKNVLGHDAVSGDIALGSSRSVPVKQSSHGLLRKYSETYRASDQNLRLGRRIH